jgi:hypothetical protein
MSGFATQEGGNSLVLFQFLDYSGADAHQCVSKL